MKIVLLYETQSVDDLNRRKASIVGQINSHSAIKGFSLRIPADVANPSPGIWTPLDALRMICLEISKATGNCEVQVRMSYGRRTPRHGAGRWVVYDGPRLGGTDSGMTNFPYPLPFDEDGGPEMVFKRWRKRAQNRQVAMLENLRHAGVPVEVSHWSWTAGTWAEPFIVQDHMQKFKGYDLDTVLDEHVATALDADARWFQQGTFALSGHVYPESIRGYVFGTLSSVIRGSNGGLAVQRNDIRNPGHTKFENMPEDYRLAWQSYSSQANKATGLSGYYYDGRWVDYDWDGIFDAADVQPNLIHYEAYPANIDPRFRAAVDRYQ